MSRAAFLNRLRSMFCIDAHLLPELDDAEWPKFRDNPPRFFMACTDAQADAIWREIERRQK